ncbi:uncharacterized protein AMSG_02036 [Thecamonas trahens ATCC 50062]|uniref:Signal transducer and activator of transcription n=1 Tax=Thecamonas trahens ATCC 50062 TaxID=461836 RepID=A0A0L0DUL2_THETB|nr:hypothetical protein AMSG_02036 [Thecamonas trahens ATCC 50062]KNC56024.1 hypothetical protein AMSG_02036 [Thecamonas trahens ATCC 50062]|eukprot:XP_013761068.1 hypothetical protein AMSG_02036 [Thecamonas trahens ATCC 50062]
MDGETLWSYIQDNPEVVAVYAESNPHFPKEVRACCAGWIESRDWSTPVRAEQAPALARGLFDALTEVLQHLETVAASVPHARFKLNRLTQIGRTLREEYAGNDARLLEALRVCMMAEAAVLEGAEGEGGVGGGSAGVGASSRAPQAMEDGGQSPREGEDVVSGRAGPLLRQYNGLAHEARGSEDELRSVQELQEEFRVQYLQNEDRIAALAQGSGPNNPQARQQLHALYQSLAQQSEQLIGMRRSLRSALAGEANMLRTLQATLGEMLGEWREKQFRKAVPEKILAAELRELRQLLMRQAAALFSLRERLEVLRFLRQQLPPAASADDDGEVSVPEAETLAAAADAMIENLVLGSWVVVEQPPSVVRRRVRTRVSIELLIGASHVVSLPMVSVQLLDAVTGEPASAQLLNATKRAEATNDGRCVAVFSSLCIADIRHASLTKDKLSAECMYRLAVSCEAGLAHGTYSLIAVSNPITLTVSRRQAALAAATMFWHEAFADSFEAITAPETVFWSALAGALEASFAASGRELGADVLAYFRSKVVSSVPGDSSDIVSFEQFAKADMGKGFSFWAWLFAAREVLESSPHMRALWADSLVAGFVPKSGVGGMLSAYPSGSFLLRFADSLLGALSISYVWDDSRGRQVVHLQPWTLTEFETISLADRIRQTEQLTLLYPTFQHRDEAFGAYYSPDEAVQAVDGYVTTGLKMTVEGGSESRQGGGESAFSFPLDLGPVSPLGEASNPFYTGMEPAEPAAGYSGMLLSPSLGAPAFGGEGPSSEGGGRLPELSFNMGLEPLRFDEAPSLGSPPLQGSASAEGGLFGFGGSRQRSLGGDELRDMLQ